MGKVTRQWGHTQWAVEIHGIVKEKWDHDILNGKLCTTINRGLSDVTAAEQPETGFGDVQDDEVEDVPARATRAARQTTARGKDLQTAPQKGKATYHLLDPSLSNSR